MNREVRRSIPPAATRKPTVTATRATERVANSSRTKEDRKLMRRVRIVSERLAASVRRSPSSWARARPKTCRVGSPATRSAKWLASRVATLNRFATAASVPANEGHENGDERDRHDDDDEAGEVV